MRVSRRLGAVVSFALVGATVAVACTYSVPDLVSGVHGQAADAGVEAGALDGSGDAPSPEVGPVDAASEDGAPAVGPPDAPATPEGGPLPSFCAGVLLYLPMDGTLVGTPAVPALVSDGGPAVGSFGPGKFGQAALFAAPAGAAFYAASGALGTTYTIPQGSVAMWVEPQGWTWPAAQARVFFKPTSALTDTFSAGASGGADPAGLVTFVEQSQGGADVEAVLGVDAAVTFASSAFNHVVSTWDEASGLLSMTLNGGAMGGAAYQDAGWTPLASTAAYLRLGGYGNVPDVWVDEVVVWSRPLSPAEIAGVYALAMPFGAACGMP
jgi:hypothetical protein